MLPNNQPNIDQEVDEWITPVEAIRIFSSVTKDPEGAKRNIADLMKDGAIAARAKQSWTVYKISLSDAWKSIKEDDLESDADVSLTKYSWRKGIEWASDWPNWRWPEARFAIKVSKNPTAWRIFKDVELRKSDLLNVLPLETAPQEQKSSRGRPIETEKWAAFFMLIIEFERKGYLKEARYGTREALLQDILYYLPAPGLSKSSIEAYSSAVWVKFVKGN